MEVAARIVVPSLLVSEMDPLDFYLYAKNEVIRRGYSYEMLWQDSRELTQLCEQDFLRETAWVIYCSGFREQTVRRVFDFLSLAFCDFESASEIVSNADKCVEAAMLGFANRQKHSAVVEVARIVDDLGFEAFKHRLLIATDPVRELRRFPYIGPVTAFHLAKNIGCDVAKPDRHLVALGARLGFDDVHSMCARISELAGDPVKVVDIVLWRHVEQIGGLARQTN
jgi:hypothetical protein